MDQDTTTTSETAPAPAPAADLTAATADNGDGEAEGDGDDNDASDMETDDDGEPTGNADNADPTDAAKPPPKKKRRPLPSPSPEPGPKPPPARPTVRMKMITTQGAGSASDPVAPPPLGPEDDPDLYIMEIPHIMLEQLRAVQHPWAAWVEETQKAAHDAQRAEEEKEEAERKEEADRKKFNAAAAALNAANADPNGAAAAGSAAAAGGPEAAGAPIAAGAPPPGIDPDLPPHLAALLSRHQEKPIAKKRTKKKEAYDVNDPFVDDSELTIDEPTHFVEPKNNGYYVCIGNVEVYRTEQQKASRKRGGPGAAGAAGKEKGKAAAGSAAAMGTNGTAHTGGPEASGSGSTANTAKARQSAIASSAKTTGAAGAMDMLLAMRAKQTGLTVSEHVVAGVQRPGTGLTGSSSARQNGISASTAAGEPQPMEGVEHESGGGDASRRQSEGSRTQPIAVDDSTDDESKGKSKDQAGSNTGGAETGASSTMTGAKRASRDKSPVKSVIENSSAGLRRTPRRSASAGDASIALAKTKEAGSAAAAAGPSLTAQTPDVSATARAADISISITGTPGGPGDKSMSSNTGGPTHSTPSGSANVQANGKKNRYPCLPVHPKLAQAFQDLKEVVAKEPFEVKTKFPAYLKPPLVRTAKLALELGEYNDNFFNWLPTIFPYNRFTMMKLTKREFFEAHSAYYRDLQEENLNALKGLVEANLPAQKLEYETAMKKWLESGGAEAHKAGKAAVPPPPPPGGGDRSSPLTPVKPALAAAGAGAEGGDDEEGGDATKAETANGEPMKKWRWDEDMRAHLHTCITAENAMVELHNEKQSLESANKNVSEIARRKALYKRIQGFWSEDGWVNTSVISREYTRTKTKYEKQAARAAEEAEAL
ncbi:hypothetical protein V8E36_000062 [Tilletia maclaganii]